MLDSRCYYGMIVSLNGGQPMTNRTSAVMTIIAIALWVFAAYNAAQLGSLTRQPDPCTWSVVNSVETFKMSTGQIIKIPTKRAECRMVTE